DFDRLCVSYGVGVGVGGHSCTTKPGPGNTVDDRGTMRNASPSLVLKDTCSRSAVVASVPRVICVAASLSGRSRYTGLPSDVRKVLKAHRSPQLSSAGSAGDAVASVSSHVAPQSYQSPTSVAPESLSIAAAKKRTHAAVTTLSAARSP